MASGDLQNPDPLPSNQNRSNKELFLFWAVVALAICVIGLWIRSIAFR